jgi:hypothetical protein
MIAAAQSSFGNQLLHKLKDTAPNVPPALITSTGATSLRQEFHGTELDGVILAYAWGIKIAFAITIASCGITAIASLATKWENVNKKKGSA